MAIDPVIFFNQLVGHDISFFTGVPDSLLKEFCLCIDDNVKKDHHIITANEGNAVGLASGYHLATGKTPLVYMQNSGLGNAINPLLSLCDPEVYSIPMVLLIGWRGEPGVKDEPQHVKQGKIQVELLEAMDIPYEIISKDDIQFELKISKIVELAKVENKPTVLLIKKGTFEKYKEITQKTNNQRIRREEALIIILENLNDRDIVVATTGKTSREIFEIREKMGQSHRQDFLTVGSMGHCSSIAFGIALAKPSREVICIDGDGSMLMHLGSLTNIASLKPKNFRHILINNQVHESVGGQETAAKSVDLKAIVEAMGIDKAYKVETASDLKIKFPDFKKCDGPSFLEVKVEPGSRKDLGRPTIKPADNKNDLMSFLEK